MVLLLLYVGLYCWTGGWYTGGGGGGRYPVLVLMVMTAPGWTCPAGVVPTTASLEAALLIGAGSSATWNPASLRRFLAASSLRPETSGMATGGAPLT